MIAIIAYFTKKKFLISRSRCYRTVFALFLVKIFINFTLSTFYVLHILILIFLEFNSLTLTYFLSFLPRLTWFNIRVCFDILKHLLSKLMSCPLFVEINRCTRCGLSFHLLKFELNSFLMILNILKILVTYCRNI